MPEFNPLYTALLIAAVVAGVQGYCAYAIMGDRWLSAWVQDRLGPNRVGPFGLLQPVADGGKMFLKEEVVPSHVDRIFFVAAPMVSFATAMLAIAVVPFGPTVAPPPPAATVAEFTAAQEAYRSHTSFVIQPGLDIGILFVFAIGSLAPYGVILAGWSSDNKYSLLGALRASAQIISYEIPMGLSVLGAALYAGTFNLEGIIDWQQAHSWLILTQPLAFLLLLTSVFAECNRLPFDLPEAEQELVGGYHTEYSNSMKLGLMLLSEYAHMMTVSFVMSCVFFGGWGLFGLENIFEGNAVLSAILKLAILGAKMSAFIGLFLLVRWTIPRFRFDQLMGIAWKVMIPLATLHLLGVLLVRHYALPLPLLTLISAGLFVAGGAAALLAGGSPNTPRRRPDLKLPNVPEGATYIAR
jgi:NADH-quinone oxidoreductase subunit H